MPSALKPLLFSLVLAGAGCAHHHEGHHEGHHEEGEHGALPASVKALHDVLAPVYHLEKGEARDTETCNALPKLKEAAQGVSAELTSDDDKPKHEAFQQALAGLEAACQAPARSEVAAKLETVHEAFHAYVPEGH
ncbi:MAG: hypothetical protein U1E65_03810 [Myxococcota bacterium]